MIRSSALWGLAALLCAPTAHAGRAKAGFKANKVKSFGAVVDVGPGLQGAIVPGVPSPVALTLSDTRGRTLSTEDGTLKRDSKRIEIVVEGGRYDPSSGAVIANRVEGEAARQATVQVRVGYAKRPDLDVVHTLPLDWRAVLGPDPGEVTALAAEPVSSEIVDDWLLPGARVGLVVHATDVHGRTYTTGSDQVLGLPWPRVAAELTGLAPVPQATGVWLSGTDVAPSSRYAVSLTYPGSEAKGVALSWRPDFQRLRGPEPGEVASLTWSLEQPADSPEGSAPLGAALPVQVEVKTTEGRTFLLRTSGKMRLVPGRLVVKTDRASWSEADLALVVDREIGGGKPFSMTLAYEGRSDLGGSIELVPDYLGSIPDGMWAEANALHAMEGRPGADGRSGLHGKAGREGRDSPDPFAVATAGGAGQPGTRGEDGRAGDDGPNVQIHAAIGWTLDRKHKVVVYQLSTDGGGRLFRVKAWDAPPIRILSVGGAGGRAGTGGDGGAGGRGGEGCLTGDGGDGADGGDGGSGGAGGRGGTIELVVAHASLLDHFTVSSEGGPGGPRGAAGRGGAGGSAPSYSSPPTEYDSEGNAQDSPSCETGRHGQEGRNGRDGHPGHAGAQGSTNTRVNAAVSGRLLLPDEVKPALTL